ncbi:hypothetical protein F2P56_003452 [Juglans regia]|uniref:ADP-ribosyl cyclase/cyclic ADP-ribose hydrolase n=1 Tax=Juglans regia TaxID=51240 RepID=A0A833XSQ1_JUGRE|nr:hypothetical protein F2P56_003452 [Juglans regia]
MGSRDIRPSFLLGGSSSPFIGQWTYDVFLSFRGADTRNNFTSHLYNALHKKGINTFIDNELRKGDEISPTLLKAIEESRISIVILSKNFASSSWCLDELTKILECKKEKEQMVLPVFYDVDPSEVRHQKNNYEKALTALEERFKDDSKVQGWKAALKEVANLSGWPVGKGNEHEFILEIVQMVSRIVNRTYLNVAKYPIGMESRVQAVNLLLSIGSNDIIRTVGIFGRGGIGKTTIAKEIYNSIAYQFEGSCFLTNVRETPKQERDLIQLQEKLLSEILGDYRNMNIALVDRGINLIKYKLCSKRILLILDDVDQMFQLEALAGGCDWFGLGSRIIITTRDKRLLINHKVDFTYQVKELDHNEALQLFCWNAFKRDKPIEGYVELTERAISYAGGLPLALMVLGSDLYNRSMHYWKRALDGYKRNPNKDIQEILRISYDGLDENVKDIFLDIACFFRGKNADYVTKILDSCGFFPDIGIEELIDKSLITINEHNVLEMHDLLQEMGREVVRQESPKEPGNRSRLWFHEDVRHVLEENTGTKKVEGILIDLPERDMIHLNPKAFMEMKRLRLFINRNADFTGGPNYLSNELRLLEWPDYPLQSLPSNFRGKNLIVLKMHNGFFKQLWDRFKNFRKLTSLDFSNCQFLTKIPDVSSIPSLESLILDNCTSLVEIHPSVGSLDKLVALRLLECSNLGSFPKSLKLPSLQVLMLGGCSSLQDFPEIECKMERLDYLDLKGTPIKELPSSFGHLIGLKDLALEGCKNLVNLPSSIHHLQHLRRLYLRGCSKLDKFPKKEEDEKQLMPFTVSIKEYETSSCAEPSLMLPTPKNSSISKDGCSSSMVFPALGHIDVGNCVLSGTDFFMTINCFSTLEQLDLSGSDFASLPECITRFVRLRSLKLEDCKWLQEILELPPKIEDIYASGCMSLARFSEVSKRVQFNTCELPGLEWIDLSRCHKLLENISMNEVENLFLDQGHFQDHLFGIIFPGNKIPDYFNHCKEVSNKSECEICISEPSHLDGKIKGLALCAVLGVNDGQAPTPIVCSIEIINNGSPSYSDSKAFNISGSDHVWLLYHVPEFYEIKGVNLQVKFWCSTSLASFRCGAQLVRTRSDTASSACI